MGPPVAALRGRLRFSSPASVYSRNRKRGFTPTTPKFLRCHTAESSSVYHIHRHDHGGNCRSRVEPGCIFLKFLSVPNFHWLGVDASNVSSPLTRFSFICLHGQRRPQSSKRNRRRREGSPASSLSRFSSWRGGALYPLRVAAERRGGAGDFFLMIAGGAGRRI